MENKGHADGIKKSIEEIIGTDIFPQGKYRVVGIK